MFSAMRLQALSLAEEGSVSAVVLVTGLVVVFAVLIMLTLIIKLYGGAIHSATGKKSKPAAAAAPAALPVASQAPPLAVQAAKPQSGEISAETMAVIAAAVYCAYGVPATAIKAVRRATAKSPGAWGMAGMLENTRPF